MRHAHTILWSFNGSLCFLFLDKGAELKIVNKWAEPEKGDIKADQLIIFL